MFNNIFLGGLNLWYIWYMVIWWMSLEMHLTTRDNLSQWAESWILKQRRAAVKQVFGPAGNHLPPPTWTSRTWSLSWSWSDHSLPRWRLLQVLPRWEGGERLATRPTCSFDPPLSLSLSQKQEKGKVLNINCQRMFREGFNCSASSYQPKNICACSTFPLTFP